MPSPLTLALMCLLWAFVVLETLILCALARKVFGLGSIFLAQVANDGLPLGSEAPAFEGVNTVQQPFDVGGKKGKYQILLFISPVCPSCRLSMMWMSQFLLEVQYIATTIVSGDPPSVRRFADEYQFGLGLVPDSRDRIAQAYGLNSTPFVIVINPEGRIAGKGHLVSYRDIGDLFKIAQMRDNMSVEETEVRRVLARV
jgi:peroxiredoxin